MTLVCIWSIFKADPKAKVYLFWQDTRADLISALSCLGGPTLYTIKTDFTLSGDMTTRIALKAKFWTFAMSYLHSQGEEPTVFMDNDLLVLQPIDSAFVGDEFDVGLTVKPELWLLNTGIMFSKCSKRSLDLFKRYLAQTESIVANPRLLAIAVSKSHPYGAPDQMAMYEVCGLGDSGNSKNINDLFRIRLFKCEIYNETRSVPIRPKLAVIHFKGGWHSILMTGSAYSRNRPRRACLPMHALYLKYAAEALAELKSLKLAFDPAVWKVTFPSYLNSERKSIIWGKYILQYMKDCKLIIALKAAKYTKKLTSRFQFSRNAIFTI